MTEPAPRVTAVTYRVVDYPWSPSDPTVTEANLNALGQAGWQLVIAYADGYRERTRWVFDQGGATGAAGIPEAPQDGGIYGRQNAAWALVSGGGSMKWVPYTTSGQSFLAQQLTRDGDWTMVANKATTTRPAPQPTAAEADLLPAWAPLPQSARASYTVYDEWTLEQAGWLEAYGVDVVAQNLGLGFTHAVSLSVNGTVRDTFTAIPQNAGIYLHDMPPVVVASGAVVRVTLTVTQTANNVVYWLQQANLFATPPPNCSLAVGSKDGAAAGTTAYGLHATFVPGAASPDWDLVAFGGAAAPGGGGLPDAPSDGNLYGRQNAAWAQVAPPSNATPLMDGAAGASGSGAAWSRSDHVHPTDTSRYAASNPSGYVNAAGAAAAFT
jgi:hypothetical protein